MTDEPAFDSAVGSPVVAAIRSQVPEFDEVFLQTLEAEGEPLGAFQAMSVFAEWVGDRMKYSPGSPDVLRAFTAVEEIASSSGYPMGRSLVTEFVEALIDNPHAVALMGRETFQYHEALASPSAWSRFPRPLPGRSVRPGRSAPRSKP